MKTAIKKENEFIPYDNIIIGSNEVSCRYLIDINGFHPIIIGKGDVPHIWLNAQVQGSKIILVDDNKESFEKIRVDLDDSKKMISIILNDKPNSNYVILSASYENKDVFEIKRMDLTPIGLSIVSNEMELIIGNNHLSGNVVKGVNAFIALSVK